MSVRANPVSWRQPIGRSSVTEFHVDGTIQLAALPEEDASALPEEDSAALASVAGSRLTTGSAMTG